MIGRTHFIISLFYIHKDQDFHIL